MSHAKDHDVGLPPERHRVVVDDRYRGYLRPVPRQDGERFLWFFEPLLPCRLRAGWIEEERITRWVDDHPSHFSD